MHILRFRPNKLAEIARKNRQEILKAGLTRRDLFKLGLLTSSGYLVAKVGLSAWASHLGTNCTAGACRLGCSPDTTPFVDPLVVPMQLPLRNPNTDPGFTFSPPTSTPNRNINPATGIPFEGRTQEHQFRDRFPAEEFFITRMGANPAHTFSDNAANLLNIPAQTVWGFNLGGDNFALDPARSPGPTLVTRYGNPVLIRRFNHLVADGSGFGVPEVSTHHHNFHSGPDSDGGPCDPNTGGFSTDPLVQGRFFFNGQFYDYFHTLARAGFDTPQFTATDGDIRETLTTLWYHDHRVDHTAENVYKGLAGMSFMFNDFDTGDENTGFRFPSFPQFDIPLILTDKLFTPEGELCFDTFDFDGLIGDKYVVNGKIQPFFEVQKRRYRFRLLDGGPSRFYRLFLVNPANGQLLPFVALTTTDGNLLPRPILINGGVAGSPNGVVLSVAERIDVIIDFKFIWDNFGQPSVIRLENRLQQDNGRGPDNLNDLDPPGLAKNGLVEFRLVGPNNPPDASFNYAAIAHPTIPCSPTDCVFTPICLPNLPVDDPNAAKEDRIRITRRFKFERRNGQWAINGEFVDCTQFRFAIERNTAERWILENQSRDWSHPIHIHLEEFRMITRNFGTGTTGGGGRIVCGDVEFGRKDVARLDPDDEIEILMRFRDFRGGWPMHCHNTIHEDHAMMLLFEVADTGDNKTNP